MTSVAHFLELVFLHPTVAALFAFTGVALGLALRKIALHRLSLLVAAAMGTLLAVTLFDVLPDAKQFLTWPALFLACASGYLFLWAIGKYVYHVCPACAVNDLEQANPQLAQTAMMLMVALGLHCTMDGLGIAFGDNLLGHPDVGLVTGISVHKVPEGLALILLLLGAGIERKKAITSALGVESMTIVGGVIGFYLANSTSTFWLGVLFAHVGGGFFYMIASAIKGVLGQHAENPRYAQHALVSGASFISSAVPIGFVAR
ncbi:MAG: ZIP family metal transporter [Candidatus Sulfotelmatobacter sp.]